MNYFIKISVLGWGGLYYISVASPDFVVWSGKSRQVVSHQGLLFEISAMAGLPKAGWEALG
jgi:hypothetical protein